ncbi:BQ2448_6609 [Microbotryum intermedium]|uniref:BQ2448_6609 protein n=1 Tax=Microbotryum intermedium TaxID=269621 RepID=A0A238FLP3_9BASI|nr:BQ2448_6609 [Microbotryum intermedium]
MSNSTSKTSAVVQTKDSAATPEAVLHLRGHRDAIDAHAAHQQSGAPDPTPLRTDRNYRAPYTGTAPDWWPQGEAVPDYRPVDRTLAGPDRSVSLEHSRKELTRGQEAMLMYLTFTPLLRPFGANTGENVFLYVMFSGIYTLHRVNGLWKNTIGRFTDKLWVYPVGGMF